MGSRIYKHYPYMSEVYLQKNCNLTVKRSLEAAGIDYA